MLDMPWLNVVLDMPWLNVMLHMVQLYIEPLKRGRSGFTLSSMDMLVGEVTLPALGHTLTGEVGHQRK